MYINTYIQTYLRGGHVASLYLSVHFQGLQQFANIWKWVKPKKRKKIKEIPKESDDADEEEEII
jgi:hypothetical protein